MKNPRTKESGKKKEKKEGIVISIKIREREREKYLTEEMEARVLGFGEWEGRWVFTDTANRFF